MTDDRFCILSCSCLLVISTVPRDGSSVASNPLPAVQPFNLPPYCIKLLEAFSCFSMDIGQQLLEIGELLLPASGTTASLKPWAATLSWSIRALQEELY
ncbi:Cytosolic Fe-S cluster assembly factor [Trichinella pseudospiralis]